jgi:hypothetical protein
MRRALIACLLLFAHGYLQAAESELGRLFFSPAERNAMDRLRRGEPIRSMGDIGSTINGYVKRSDGNNTVWVSGSPYAAGAQLAGQLNPAQVQSTDQVMVQSTGQVIVRSANPKSAGEFRKRKPARQVQ